MCEHESQEFSSCYCECALVGVQPHVVLSEAAEYHFEVGQETSFLLGFDQHIVDVNFHQTSNELRRDLVHELLVRSSRIL